jgi:hypothetical protein
MVFGRRRPLFTATELNGLIIILMRLDANGARIAAEVAGEEDGE